MLLQCSKGQFLIILISSKMDQFTKEGRKLRPRRTSGEHSNYEVVDYHASSRSSGSDENRGNSGESTERSGERSSYGDRRQGGYGDRSGGYGDRRQGGYGDHSSSGYGDRRSGGYGDRRQGGYGDHSNSGYGDRRTGGYGDHRSGGYGDRRQGGYGDRSSSGYGDRRQGGNQYGEHRSYGDRSNSSYGDRRQGGYGDRSGSYGDRRPSSSYDNRSSFGSQGGDGERRPYGDRGPRPFANRRPYGSRPPRQFSGSRNAPGARRPFAHHEEAFTKETEIGIDKMLESRPIVNGSESTETTFESPVQNVVRLNKLIANSGVCSRREADTLIQAGVVTVNGTVITELGTKVDITKDDVRFNGERLKGEEKVYIIMNKPKGVVTTSSDPHAEKTVTDLITGCSTRVYPVGRLDKNTTGVLMLTNDGEIAERLTHPAYDKKKIYQVALDKALTQEDFDHILSGVTLSDGDVKADELEYIDENDKRKLGIEIHSGKNRVVRRIFESLGYNVVALDRVYFAGLTKKGLKKGEWRYLTEGEANILKMGAYV